MHGLHRQPVYWLSGAAVVPVAAEDDRRCCVQDEPYSVDNRDSFLSQEPGLRLV